MLEVSVKPQEYTIENSNGEVEIHMFKGGLLQLEHSLISLSKWESMYKKPFLTSEQKTIQETIDYIKCMTINKNVNPDIYYFISNKNIDDINKYIDDPRTATTFGRQQTNNRRYGRETITSEIIYYWMIALQIPVKFETWHLNRLLTLIRVCEIKNRAQNPNRGKKGMSATDRHKLNMSRRAAKHSSG